MTDEHVEYLAARFRAGERSESLRLELKQALYAAAYGEVDPGFGREIEAALGQWTK